MAKAKTKRRGPRVLKGDNETYAISSRYSFKQISKIVGIPADQIKEQLADPIAKKILLGRFRSKIFSQLFSKKDIYPDSDN